jgi:hypothetical protein
MASTSGILSEWSKWELINTEPLPYANVTYLIFLRDDHRESYRLHPFSGWQIGTYIRVSSLPNNRGESFWFDENNNFHSFFKTYMVVP